MIRALWVVGISVAMAMALDAQGRAPSSSAAASQMALQRDLGMMQARLAAGATSVQVIADAQRLAAFYGGLGRYASGFGPADYTLNRRLGEQSFYWLSRARGLYVTDWAVSAQLMYAYAAMGSFYRSYGTHYPAAAFMSYGSASRLARWLYLAGVNRDAVERELQQYALAYASAACAGRVCFDWWVQPNGTAEPVTVEAGHAPPAPAVLQLPRIDLATLSSEQRAQWTDLQDRFRPVAARVLEAHIRVNELAARLAQRGESIHPMHAANAASMQGFLEDAVELADAHEFRLALEAVTKAEAVRARLKNVVGQ